MNFFRNNPFIKILGFWLTGIFLQKYLPSSVFLLIGFILALAFFDLIFRKNNNLRSDLTNSLLACSVLTLLAFGFTHENNSPQTSSSYYGYFSAILLEPPQEKQNSYQLNVEIHFIESSKINKTKAIFYAQKSEKPANLKVGNQLIGKTTIRKIKNRGNPFEFDYAGYLARQGIHYSAFIKDENYQHVGEISKSIRLMAESFRTKLLSQLQNYIKDDESFQLISALTLGYRKELSPELKSHFASTGAMHVLAVSGLHVGIIFLIFSQLLFFLKRNRKTHLLYILIIATILWGYAMLTGFSPSVQRSAVMFSFILIGNSFKRPTSIYNTLAASAFLLLLFNPNLLFEIGFQLSYMAVLSIVFFYPRLEKLIKPKNWVVKKIWQLLCISLAAQIGTFSLSIYYFNQFPLYFWLSNLVVIPAAYLILGLTFTLFIFSPISLLAVHLATLLEMITHSTIFLLIKIEHLPYSLIEGISISTPQALSLLATSISAMFFIRWKRKIYFFASLLFVLFFQVDGLTEKWQLLNQHRIIIYSSDKWMIHLINGRQNYLLYENEYLPNTYILQNTLSELQLNKPVFIKMNPVNEFYSSDLLTKNGIIQFLDHRISIPQNNKMSISTDTKLTNKYLKTKLESITQQSIFLKHTSNIPSNSTFHFLDTDGAFMTDI